MRTALLTAAVVLATAVGSPPVAAQFTQYLEPGSLAEPHVSAAERIETQAREARWSLGKLRIEPRLSISNLGYVNNVFDATRGDEQISDFKGTAAVGLDSYVHLGPKAIAHGFAIASYSWWREQEQLRVLNGSFGARLFALFNRLEIEAEGGHVERERNLSTELEVPVQLREDRAAVSFDVDVRGPFAFFGSAVGQRTRHSDDIEQNVPGLDVSTLDRDTQLFSLGLSYTLRSGLTVGLGGERTNTDFPDDRGGRANSGSGPLLSLRYEGNRFDVGVAAVYRAIEFDDQPAEDLEQLTGTVRVGWRSSEKTGLTLFAGARLGYGAIETEGIIDGSRYGLALRRILTRRSQLSFFLETGEDEHITKTGEPTGRSDDLESFGGAVSFDLTERLVLHLGWRRTERDSTLPEFDRSIDALLSSLELSGELLPW